MNAKELRIGNMIMYQEDSTVFDVYEINETGARVRNDIEDTWIELDQFSGIPLSPDILLKCGFVNNRSGEPSIEINDIASHLELMKGVDNYYYPSITQTPQGDEERTIYLNRINSVHHLQNLFYALTGQELNIKL